MRTGRMAHALVSLGLWAAFGALLVSALTADAVRAVPSVLVAYLGTGADPRDDFEYLLSRVRKAQARLPPAVRFEMFVAPGDTIPALQAAVAAAAQAHAALIVAPTARSARVAALRAATTPLVFASYDDPLAAGFIASMQRRPEPVAGIFYGDRLDGKRLELLRDAYPQVQHVAVLGDQDWVVNQEGAARVVAEGRRLGLEVTPLLAESGEEVRALLADPQAGRFDAWYLPTTNVGVAAERVVVDAMRRMHRPCIFASLQPVKDGGLMAYTQDVSFIWDGLAELIGRVVAGEDAGSIPILRPQRFVLAVRTGPGTGVPAPDVRVVRRADIVYR
jgi:putative ABC transport system substrate-binding protein